MDLKQGTSTKAKPEQDDNGSVLWRKILVWPVRPRNKKINAYRLGNDILLKKKTWV